MTNTENGIESSDILVFDKKEKPPKIHIEKSKNPENFEEKLNKIYMNKRKPKIYLWNLLKISNIIDDLRTRKKPGNHFIKEVCSIGIPLSCEDNNSESIKKICKKLGIRSSGRKKENIRNIENYPFIEHTTKKGGRGDNDKNNAKREQILCALLNKQIPDTFFAGEYGQQWTNMKEGLFTFIHDNFGDNYKTMKCILKAGRQHHHDFSLIFTYEDDTIKTIPLEFKHGITSIVKGPQFLSISSKHFIPTNYSTLFYDSGYVNQLSEVANINTPPPDRYDYLRFVCQSNYGIHAWFAEIKEREERCKTFKNNKKGKVNESIHNYLVDNHQNLDIKEINETLAKKEKNKKYMCYKNRLFYYDEISEDELYVTSIDKLKCGRDKSFNTIVLNTRSTSKLHMLLRWKNHAGVLFPAWQIKLVRI